MQCHNLFWSRQTSHLRNKNHISLDSSFISFLVSSAWFASSFFFYHLEESAKFRAMRFKTNVKGSFSTRCIPYKLAAPSTCRKGFCTCSSRRLLRHYGEIYEAYWHAGTCGAVVAYDIDEDSFALPHITFGCHGLNCVKTVPLLSILKKKRLLFFDVNLDSFACWNELERNHRRELRCDVCKRRPCQPAEPFPETVDAKPVVSSSDESFNVAT